MSAYPRILRILIGLVAVLVCANTPALGQTHGPENCLRPVAGSVAAEPQDLRSDRGMLEVTFKFLTSIDAQGHVRYCYLYKDGSQSPTLRVNPGDTLILHLENDIAPEASSAAAPAIPMHMQMQVGMCSQAKMTAASTNLHFHGL